METYRKKKLEIILEEPVLRTALAVIDRLGATGYTVLPSLAGKGRDGAWREAHVGGGVNRVMVIVIAEENLARSLLEEVHIALRDYTAIVYLSDVEVVRVEHF
ncbi:MAG: P-II family nitrogen regulator [Inquilinaceae bacterium]